MVSSFRIGEWLVEPLHNRLVRGDTRVKLDPRVMQVLVYLAGRPNEIAGKESLIASVWEGTFVTDEVLTNAIFELRKALGDDAREPRFIQTVPRKGYRLIVPVEAPPVGRERSRRRGHAAAVGVLGLAALSWWYAARRDVPAPELRVTPLTGYPGAEWWPALSPDGERVAYVWDGGKPGVMDLYVQLIDGGEPLRLTETPLHEYSPVWSHDGKEIAFLRELATKTTESGAFIIPAMGGPERRIATIGAEDVPSGGVNPGMDWSPDGRFLAASDREIPGGPYGIVLLSLESGEKQRITSATDRLGDLQPAFSPDGKVLAFARLHGVVESEIFLLTPGGAKPKLLTTQEGWVTDLAWSSDSEALVYAVASEAEAGTSLWKVPVRGGTPVRLPFGELAHILSISGRRGRMVYDRRSWYDTDLFRIDGPTAKERGAPIRLISSSRLDWAQSYSPDGTRVAFASERSGKNNIWICRSDGTGCYQLTDMLRAVGPSWSPDGRRIAFSGQEERGLPEVYVTDTEGGFTRALTSGPSGSYFPSWSRDGKWIYFSSRIDGEMQIWKTSAGGGEPLQLTRGTGTHPLESADGRYVYYVHAFADRSGRSSVQRIPVEGGEDEVIPRLKVHPRLWTLWTDKIVYAGSDHADDFLHHIDVFDLDTGDVRRIFSTEGGFAVGMTVSPDGRWVLLSMGDPTTSDLMLVEGFR